jgi:uncharacterized membrane protein
VLAEQDEGRNVVLVMTATAAIMSLAVILVWLRGEPANERHAWFDLGLVFVTILLCWAFIHTIFALHYAQ